MSHFSVNILTPASVVAEGLTASTITVPTVCGEIQILPEHTHIIEKLATGILKISDGEDKLFTVTTGICKVLGNQVTILSDVSESVEIIDKERAEQALKLSKEKLATSNTLSQSELRKYTLKMVRAEMRLKALLSK